jgi:hypothetical protein
VAEYSDYQVFGLRVRSDIPLPELFPAMGDGEADVTISRGAVDASTSEPGIRVDGDGLILTIPTVAQYRIEQGNRILVDGEADVPERNLRLFLLGSAFGALLHQRGLLPLHANAVEIDGKAVAFMGESGAGKSTLAAWFHDRGYRVIADDVCVVAFDVSGGAVALPGLPRLRLWRDALDLTGRLAEDFDRSYVSAADDQFDKFDVPIASDASRSDAVEIAAVCLLKTGKRVSLTQLSGVAAAEAVFENTYRGKFVSAANAQHDHWNSAIRLVRAVPLFRLERQWGLSQADAQNEALLARFSSLIGGS